MATNDPRAAALLSHIVFQTQTNIEFLVSQNYISPADAQTIQSRLSSLDSSSAVDALSHQVPLIDLNAPNGRAPSPSRPVVLSRRSVPLPTQRPVQARAVWGYNEDGQELNDLSFRPGDVVEIVSETNADWWTGRINGRQGLFPSTYVEKIIGGPNTTSPTPTPVPPPVWPSGPSFQGPYSSPQGPPNQQWQPPPNQQWQPPPQNYQPPPPNKEAVYLPPQVPVPAPQQVQGAPPDKKKNKFGKLGSTVASSAAGGVGFGAGAAIGSGIINAIF